VIREDSNFASIFHGKIEIHCHPVLLNGIPLRDRIHRLLVALKAKAFQGRFQD
jgi:hypothetical protein